MITIKNIKATGRYFKPGVLWIVFIFIAAMACQDDKVDEVFDKPAAERSQQSITSLRELLKSSPEGWTASYKPSKTETGYYRFLFRFLADSVVEMASDFSQADLTVTRSTYDILQGSTTKLSFSTFSPLHKLSDSRVSPIPGDLGSGLKGDFEFLYYGTTAEGDIIFRTNRVQDTLIFRKATATSLPDLSAAYQNIERMTAARSVYRALEESKNGNVIARSAFDFPYNARVISIQGVVEEEVDGQTVSSFEDGYISGYGFTPNGIFLDSVKLDDGRIVRFPEFTYDEDNSRFVHTVSDGTLLSIGDINSPIVPVDGQKYLLDPTLTARVAFTFGDADIGPLTTPAFEEIYYNAAVGVGFGASFSGCCTTRVYEESCIYLNMQGRKQYQEKLFTSFQLSDRVPADNLYRRITELIDFQFLYQKTEPYYGREGQASIDPVVFFKLMLVGYLENLCSDRRIIQISSMRMDVLFFLGYDIDEPLPWHSTLSRTRQLYGEAVFEELFKQVLKQCIDKGMVSGRRQAVDSVLIKANASMDSLLEKEILDDVATYSHQLDENENQDNVISLKAENEKDKGRNNKSHYSPTDNDARIATKPGKPVALNYLGQLSVDTSNHVITHAQVFHADKKDSQCLEEVVSKVVRNLGESSLEVEQVLADGNYSSSEALESLEGRNITGYIPNFGPYKSNREGFIYDATQDRYMCPNGKYLLFKGFKKHHGVSRQYKSSSNDCNECPLKISCIGSKTKLKSITNTLSKPVFDRMDRRVGSGYGFKMKKLRQSTVEPVIGTLVNFLGLKRINTKGLSSATKCMVMAALAYNLKKLVRFCKRNHPLQHLRRLTMEGCLLQSEISFSL